MICQKCQTEVDDDLIFCTNCGARLFEPKTEAQTVLIDNSVVTQVNDVKPRETVADNEPAVTGDRRNDDKNKSSNLKWVALIIALVAIPASIFGVLLLMKSRNQPTSSNVNQSPKPSATPTRKATPNQNANANVSNANANKANANSDANLQNGTEKNSVMNERIGIAPQEHYAVPFEVESETARFSGKVTVLEGERVDVFVYLKSEYDQYFPDPNHKVFSFETRKSEETSQVLVEEDYVLVFVNKTDKPLNIQGNFSLAPVETPAK